MIHMPTPIITRNNFGTMQPTPILDTLCVFFEDVRKQARTNLRQLTGSAWVFGNRYVYKMRKSRSFIYYSVFVLATHLLWSSFSINSLLLRLYKKKRASAPESLLALQSMSRRQELPQKETFDRHTLQRKIPGLINPR